MQAPDAGRVGGGIGAWLRESPRRCPPPLIALILAVLLAGASSAPADTTVPAGHLGSDTVWSVAGSPYIVQGQLDLAGGMTLTVEPGVAVRFAGGAWLQVFGRLAAGGTAAAPITFASNATAPQRGDWGGIEVRPGGAALLAHCEESHAGTGGFAALRVYSSDVTVQDCTLHDNLGDGAYLEGSGLHPAFENVRVENNGAAAIRQYGAGMSPAYSHLTFSGNGADGVMITGGWTWQDGTLDGAAAGQPFIAEGTLGVSGGTLLAITAGTTLRFRAGSGVMVVAGTLHADGTATAPITFTSDAATPQRGDWGGIEVRPGGAARLADCDLGYAGKGSVAALRTYSSDVTVQDGALHDNLGDGAYLEGGGLHPTLERVRVERNGGAAIRQYGAGMSPVYSALTFAGNGQDGVVITGGWMSQDGALDGAAMGQPFIAEGTLGVNGGTRLTITAGTTLRFHSGSGAMYVVGTLRAEGTAAAPITFTSEAASPQRGDWGGVEVRSGGSVRLAHLDLGHAGWGSFAALRVLSSDVTARDCTIHDNLGDGAYLEGGGLHPTLERVRSERNGLAAIRQSEAGMVPVYSDLAFFGNGLDGVAINNGWMSQDGTLDGGAAGQPFIVEGNLGVSGGKLMTLTAGTTLRFRKGSGVMTVAGTLRAEGTASAPITFTSDAGTPQPGDWDGVEVWPSGSVRLANFAIGHAGRGSFAALRVSSSTVSMTDGRLHDNQADAVVLSGGGLRPTLLRLEITSNGGAAIRQSEPGMSPVYRSLSLTGNGLDAIAIEGGSLAASATWNTSAAGAEIRLLGAVTVPAGQLLSLVAGTTVRAAAGARFAVWGAFYAIGTAAAPITLVGLAGNPASWSGVEVSPGATAILDHCEVAYGGELGAPVLSLAASAAVSNCRIHGGAGDGVRVTGARPAFAGNQIYGNAFGLRNTTPETVVDARYNWWGHASGPRHASNPAGQGDAVSDGVLFDPWLAAPGEWQAPQPGVVVKAGGPSRVSPGQAVEYSVFYLNQLAEPVNGAVLILVLPGSGSYVDATGDGIYWPQLRQVFWRLGDLVAGGTGTVSARVRFPWGLQEGLRDSTMALLGGSNLPLDDIDIGSYLAYEPILVTSEATLSQAELAAERQGHPDLDQLIGEATGSGLRLMDASSVSLSDQSVLTRVALGRRDALQTIERRGETTLATTLTPTSFAVEDTSGGMTLDLAAGVSTYRGSWDAGSAAPVTAAGTAKPLTRGQCMKNAMIRTLVTLFSREVASGVMFAGTSPPCTRCYETGDLVLCARCWGRYFRPAFPGKAGTEQMANLVTGAYLDCVAAPDDGKCTAPLAVCMPASLVPPGWREEDRNFSHQWSHVCRDGVYALLGETSPCESGATCVNKVRNGTKTLEGRCSSCEQQEASVSGLVAAARALPRLDVEDRVRSCASLSSPLGTCSIAPTTIRTAHDPNEKAGPQGDVLPGQRLDYTVSYENLGQGIAYGVCILDTLSPHLDESTLTLPGDATFTPATRELLWEVGELAPKGEAGSKGAVGFSVNVRTGLASGTVITNQAVVNFPSVPEETPTNTVVNVVQPLAATPQSLATTYLQPLPITLAGNDVSGLPLTFSVAAQPLGGELTGTPPQLTYTPSVNFTGLDSFTFTVANGVSLSRPAAVEIMVEPSAADTTPPDVLWTYPAAGATLSAIVLKPVPGDAGGPLYAPSLLAQLSEAVDPATVRETTVEVRDATGRQVAAVPSFDGVANRMAITLRERWQATTYTVTLGTGIKDLAGNPLAAPFTWSFTAEPQSLVRWRLHASR